VSGDIIDLDEYRRRKSVGHELVRDARRALPGVAIAATVAGVVLVELGRELAQPEAMPRPLCAFLSRLIGGPR
jgi:hypothetical protein